MYLFALLIAFGIGYLSLRLLVPHLYSWLHILFGLALGLGIVSHLGFYTHIVFNCFAHLATPLLSLALLGLLFFFNRPLKQIVTPTFTTGDRWGLLVLGLLSIPLWMEAHFYPLGGWDAWSCWNLKAKFIYLGGEQWKNMLDPVLWRSNTHYPLFLPLLNVWFWQWTGMSDAPAMFNAVVYTLLSAGVLFWTLFLLTKKTFPSAVATLLAFALPFSITLSVSQYSDLLLGFYALSAICCFLLAEDQQQPRLKILALVFLGFLSFTKTEGLVAAGILTGLYFFFEGKGKKSLAPWAALGLAVLPTVTYTLFFAPKNEAFINGLTSSTHPADFSRLLMILIYPFRGEVLNPKWNGLWFLLMASLILAGRNVWQGRLKMIGLFLLGYLGIVLCYYFLNTFFPIVWWLQTTFDRIVFALIPICVLWCGLALGKK